MKKFVCTVCGYVHEGDSAPELCPICKAPADKFKEQSGEKSWAAEHVVGVAKGVDEEIIKGLGQSTFSDAFTFALLIIVLCVKPTGLFGEKVTDKV